MVHGKIFPRRKNDGAGPRPAVKSEVPCGAAGQESHGRNRGDAPGASPAAGASEGRKHLQRPPGVHAGENGRGRDETELHVPEPVRLPAGRRLHQPRAAGGGGQRVFPRLAGDPERLYGRAAAGVPGDPRERDPLVSGGGARKTCHREDLPGDPDGSGSV